mgnify:CR=1 FL=1
MKYQLIYSILIFQDYISTNIQNNIEIIKISEIFRNICEFDSLYVSSIVSEKAAILGSKVQKDIIIIENPNKINTKCFITINGIRKDKKINKFKKVPKYLADLNNKFWNFWNK